MATASAAPPAGHATTAPSPPPAQAGTRVRLQIAPLADAEVARWQALLDRLPATGTVQRVLVRDGTATFALTTGSMARLHAQLRQLAETVGAAFAPTDTGALLLHLDAAALPVPTPAA